MRDEILAQPHQIGDALWRVDAGGLATTGRSGGLAICGVGGSAIGGDLALAAIGDRAAAPIRTLRGYGLEPWTSPETLVLCASYSGSTEETLAAFDAAGELGAPRVALTTGGPLAERARDAGVPVIGIPGGMQPRASVIYMTVAALQVAAGCGAAPPLRDEIEGSAPVLEAIAADTTEADAVAETIAGTIAVIHGGGPTAAPATRWKAQLNENAKLTAFASVLPEANHNEIEGWEWGQAHAPFSATFLEAPGQHGRIARRTELTSELLAAHGIPVARIAARGETPVAYVLSLVMLGDLVSVRVAELAGVDPTPVATLDAFKRSLTS